MSNVYSKLQDVRVKLQNTNLKKSGLNKFSGFTYFELADFLPVVNKFFNENGLFGSISFTADMATLTIVNTENPEEKIEFTSPMSTATLKGCHDIQNLGAVQTYLRRYLYMNALEIVEADALDPQVGNDKQSQRQSQTVQNEQTETHEMTLKEAEKMIIKSKKFDYKEMTLKQLYEKEPDFVKWMAESHPKEQFKTAAQVLLKAYKEEADLPF